MKKTSTMEIIIGKIKNYQKRYLSLCIGLILTTVSWAQTTDDFVTTWSTEADGESITIPTVGDGYDYSVDWGDGSTSSNLTANATHVYATAGTHTVRISGAFPRIYFNQGGDRNKIVSVNQWGTNEWASMEAAFAGCQNLTIAATDVPNLSSVTNMNAMFRNATALGLGNGNWDWDVSNVINMNLVFNHAENFNKDIGNWNVANVLTMNSMFTDADTFNQDLDSWNVSNVRTMQNMFLRAGQFDGEIGSWNVQEVTNMSSMFNSATRFSRNISNWNVGNVTSMAAMFNEAQAFDHNIGDWDVSKVSDMSEMFSGVTLSTNNYDAILVGWSQLVLQSGANFDAGNSTYCAEAEKLLIINNFGWSFTDGGPASSCPEFITTWQTTTSNESITIPTHPNGTYLYSVDWGDGSDPTVHNNDATHTYSTPNTYTVTITGTFPHIYFNNSGDRNKIMTIVSWGANQWASMERAFAGCENLTITANDTPNLSGVTNLSYMFLGATSLTNGVGNWDVSNATNMSGMFEGASNFNENLNSWDVSNVERTDRMFLSASNFNGDISAWDVGQVNNMDDMFHNATTFNISVNGWNVSEVQSMNSMFKNATNFNGALNGWNTGKVTDMRWMFQNAIAFNGVIGSWNVSEVTDMTGMFEGAADFNIDIDEWNVGKVTSMATMFKNATGFDQNISGWNVQNVNTMVEMFSGVQLSTDNYDALLIGWSQQALQSNVIFDGGSSIYCSGRQARQHLIDDFAWQISDGGLQSTCGNFVTVWRTTEANESITIPTFPGAGYDYTVDWGDNSLLTVHSGDATHVYAAPGDYEVKISGIFPRIYFNIELINSLKIIELKSWGIISWTSMERAFAGCKNMVLTALDTPDLSSVTDLSYMFAGVWSLTDGVGNWTVSNITDMEGMFEGAIHFNEDLSNWDVSNVERMNRMFLFAPDFNADISGWNTSKVNDMSYMFADAHRFNQDISGWDVSNVTNMEGMFEFANAFNQDLNTWNVSNVNNMRLMFSRANNFHGPISAWDVSNVKDMGFMFDRIDQFNGDISTWNVSNVENMEHMFYGAKNFNGEIGNWNVTKVTDMEFMFNRAPNFNRDLSGWDVSAVTDMSFMFQMATSFDQDLGQWDVSNVINMNQMFDGTSLSTDNYDSLLEGWSQRTLQFNVPFNAGGSQYCLSEAARDALIKNYGWKLTDGGPRNDCQLRVSPRVYLQGAALNPSIGEEGLMRDDLRTNGHIPTTSPYEDDTQIDASILATTGSDAIVDWVWVQLMEDSPNLGVVTGRSALLQRDGDVVETDGVSPVAMARSMGSYHVAIRHRNHLGIMSEHPISLSTASSTIVDFSDGSTTTYGEDAQTTFGMPMGISAMWAGDANTDRKVTFLNAGAEAVEIKELVLERSAIESPFGASVFYKPQGYYDEDLDMNGEVIFLNAGNELVHIKNNILVHPKNQLFKSVFYVILGQLP